MKKIIAILFMTNVALGSASPADTLTCDLAYTVYGGAMVGRVSATSEANAKGKAYIEEDQLSNDRIKFFAVRYNAPGTQSSDYSFVYVHNKVTGEHNYFSGYTVPNKFFHLQAAFASQFVEVQGVRHKVNGVSVTCKSEVH